MASAEARAYIEVWGRSPQRGSRAEPPVGVRGETPEAESSVACFIETLMFISRKFCRAKSVVFEGG